MAAYPPNHVRTVFSILPIGTHTRVDAGTLVTLNAPDGASILLLEADQASVRYTIDETTTPTADIGFLLEAGDATVRIDLYEKCEVRVIGAGAFINYQWARPAVNLF